MNQMRNVNKADEFLSTINIFLSSTTDRITPNIILFVTMVNGFILGFLTTGYLGAQSMGVFTLTFWLFVEQFVVICFFSSKYVNLTTGYLNKFFLSAVIGFGLQWQAFGLYAVGTDIKTIEPLVDHGFATFMFGYFGLMMTKYCFTGNETKHETKINMNVE